MAKSEVTRREVEDTDQTVEGLCSLARKLGYKDRQYTLQNSDGSCVGDFLLFLEDNPGAVEAVVTWVLEEGRTSEGEELSDEDDEEIVEDEGEDLQDKASL